VLENPVALPDFMARFARYKVLQGENDALELENERLRNQIKRMHGKRGMRKENGGGDCTIADVDVLITAENAAKAETDRRRAKAQKDSAKMALATATASAIEHEKNRNKTKAPAPAARTATAQPPPAAATAAASSSRASKKPAPTLPANNGLKETTCAGFKDDEDLFVGLRVCLRTSTTRHGTIVAGTGTARQDNRAIYDLVFDDADEARILNITKAKVYKLT